MEPWIETYTGKVFEFLDPKSEMIDIVDIAHALSLTCRFSGHCAYFYSVAEHSVYVSDLVPKEQQLAALLHDASEAYITDVAKPIKGYLSNYAEMEDKIMRSIALKFGFEYPLTMEIHQADLTMLSKEAYYLLPSQGNNWTMWDYIQRPDKCIGSYPVCVTPELAKQLFLTRFTELYGQDRIDQQAQAA